MTTWPLFPFTYFVTQLWNLWRRKRQLNGFPTLCGRLDLVLCWFFFFFTTDLGTRFVIHPPGLSVVSAPAPVFQRPDIGSPHTGWPNHHPFRVSSPTNAIPSHRSTRSQRVRGVTNSVRLRELEMRENQAYVLSWRLGMFGAGSILKNWRK